MGLLETLVPQTGPTLQLKAPLPSTLTIHNCEAEALMYIDSHLQIADDFSNRLTWRFGYA